MAASPSGPSISVISWKNCRRGLSEGRRVRGEGDSPCLCPPTAPAAGSSLRPPVAHTSAALRIPTAVSILTRLRRADTARRTPEQTGLAPSGRLRAEACEAERAAGASRRWEDSWRTCRTREVVADANCSNFLMVLKSCSWTRTTSDPPCHLGTRARRARADKDLAESMGTTPGPRAEEATLRCPSPFLRCGSTRTRQSSWAATPTASDSAVEAVADAGTSGAGSVGLRRRREEPRKKAGRERTKLAGQAGRRTSRTGADARTSLGSSSACQMRRRRRFGQTRLSGSPSREGRRVASLRRREWLWDEQEKSLATARGAQATSLDVRPHAREEGAGKACGRNESRFSKREGWEREQLS